MGMLSRVPRRPGNCPFEVEHYDIDIICQLMRCYCLYSIISKVPSLSSSIFYISCNVVLNPLSTLYPFQLLLLFLLSLPLI
jgi:hypothetical protein